jgi:hypothetical protein
VTEFVVPGSLVTNVLGINKRAAIVGQTLIAGKLQGFLLDGGVVVLIDVAGSTLTAAHGINSRGDIVGSTTIGGASYGFLVQ